MKINFIVPEISRTGGMNIIFQYANRLLERGHDVVLYTQIAPFNLYKNRIKPYYLKYQIKSVIKWLYGKSVPENIYSYNFRIKYVPLMNSLFVRDADVSIATSWPTAYPVYNFPKSKGRKYYLVQDYETWNSNIKYVDRSYKLPLKKIVCSKYLKDLLSKKFNESSELIYFGLDLNRFHNTHKKYNDPPVILFMDHPLPDKNTESSIYTCIRLKEKYPFLRFRAFGIRKYHNIPEFVEFTENPDDNEITRLYSESDVFIYPSLREGFAATPAEAMACGTAAVANKIGAIGEYSEHMKTAVHADPSDKDGICKGVELLINNRELLVKISEAGYNHIRNFLNWEKSISKFEDYISR
jgi:glycosyltransferase involved in cell wall biosynthesis